MRAWKQNGVVQRLRVVARRGGSNSRFVFQISILERKTLRASLGFPRRARLTRGAELQRIAREGRRIRTTYIEVRAAASPLAHSPTDWLGTRVGLIIPRFKHSAVARNLVKRRLRELVRLELLPTGLLVDVVLRIRPEAYGASYENLASDIAQALVQLRCWHQRPPAETPMLVEGSGSTKRA